MRRASLQQDRPALENSRAARGAGVTAALWLIAIAAIVFLLRAAGQLLIPIVIGVLISYALEPVVEWMCRRRIPRRPCSSCPFRSFDVSSGSRDELRSAATAFA